MKISGNTALITGGATGIGFALAEAFLEKGNEVIICGRRENKLEEAWRRHPELHTRVCDVSNGDDRRSLFEWVRSKFPSLNILVNNAGIQRRIDLSRGDAELAGGENEVRINLEAPVYLTSLFITHLASKKESAIVNISSGSPGHRTGVLRNEGRDALVHPVAPAPAGRERHQSIRGDPSHSGHGARPRGSRGPEPAEQGHPSVRGGSGGHEGPWKRPWAWRRG